MNRSHLWKALIVLLLVSWSVTELVPPTPRDYLVVFREETQPGRRDAIYTNILERFSRLQGTNSTAQTATVYRNLKVAIGTNDITRYFPQFTDAKNQKEPTSYVLNQLQRRGAGKIKLGLDLQGGFAFMVEMKTNQLADGTSKIVDARTALDNAVEVLRKRVDQFGVAEPLLQPLYADNRILIQMPGLSESERDSVRQILQKAAFLEFRWVHPQVTPEAVGGLIPAGYEVLKETKVDKRGQTTVQSLLVEKRRIPDLTGKNIVSANVDRNNLNQPEIHFRLDGDGTRVFGKITTEGVGRQLAIILDGELSSAPVIRSPITGGYGQIEMGTGSNEKEAFDLAAILQNPLEAPVEIIQESVVDPSLGKDTIRSGVTSALIGTILVAGFMLVYYLSSGVVANAALCLNIIILLGTMCSFGTTLTLPGIAGIVLTIGMAVDANVLIFERIREEFARGKSLRGALSAGYDRAFWTIFDSNLTTLIASVLLIYLGTGPIRGFGVALTIGICVSMFTALVVTRLIFDFLLARGWLNSLPMMHIIKGSKIDFMGKAKPAFIVSWIIIVVGCGYGLVRGKHALGIDFLGGDTVSLAFQQKVESEQVRQALEKGGIRESMVQYQNEIGGARDLLRVTVPYKSGYTAVAALTNALPQAGFSVTGSEQVGPTVGEEVLRSAVVAALLALFGILVYVALRYEFSFAVGAVLAVLHDVLMTIGVFCLTGLLGEGHSRQFNATVVAAILTIIGFSINDTIVIFDRIREDLKLGVRGSFRELLNQALNETLSRTIITSGTVFLATVALLVWGGGAINDFAFTFLIGILTGTYSSIYIASALVLWWHKGERPKIGSAASPANATAIANAASPTQA